MKRERLNILETVLTMIRISRNRIEAVAENERLDYEGLPMDFTASEDGRNMEQNIIALDQAAERLKDVETWLDEVRELNVEAPNG